MKFAGASLLALPVCFTAYGVIRFVGRLDGRYGPGLDWQAAHLVNLVGLLLFVLALLALRRAMPRTTAREVAVVATLLGVATTVVQFVVDVLAGLVAADRAGMTEFTRAFTGVPGVRPVFYVVGPPLLYVGLLALTVLLVRAGTLAWWSPALVLVGSGLTIVSLDLIPVAGLCLLAALTPLGRLLGRTEVPVRGAHARRVGGLPY
ncbi:hypothetical protein ACFFQW_36095 [Umezawaea endophytica]|uniref:Uncharacterized protein n=1 Tax=Umezawaea endophytica TaxID=1654476 RepID=A0A9X3AEY6_9PSEU|nr:hypothetical protein [Umezawaea endophytica]MCS7477526.1 hypothetical protein [Umezawaea endophytica]